MFLWTLRTEEYGEQLDKEFTWVLYSHLGIIGIYLLFENTRGGLMNKKRSMLYWSSRRCGPPKELCIRISKNKTKND